MLLQVQIRGERLILERVDEALAAQSASVDRYFPRERRLVFLPSDRLVLDQVTKLGPMIGCLSNLLQRVE